LGADLGQSALAGVVDRDDTEPFDVALGPLEVVLGFSAGLTGERALSVRVI
jgi:hypothetical protein